MCEYCAFFVWVDFHVSLCGQQQSKCELVLIDSKKSVSVITFVGTFFPHNDTSQNIDISSSITRYKFYGRKILSSYNGLYLDDGAIQCDAMCLYVWELAFLVYQLPPSSWRKNTITLILVCSSSLVLVLVCQTVWLTHGGRVTQICVFTLQLCKKDDANLRF